MQLALRNDVLPQDCTNLFRERWGEAKVLRSRTTGIRYAAYVVDDGVDPTAYLIHSGDDEHYLHSLAEDVNRERDALRKDL